MSEEETQDKKGVLYIGIDLGTSRTSVAASNGVRETVWSYVGYPKDVVSRKLLKKDRLYGKEAVQKRLSLDLYRPFEKGVIKFTPSEEAGLSKEQHDRHMKAAKDLVQYVLSLAKPRKDELLYGVIGAPAQASFQNKTHSLEAAKNTLDAVMICSEPFAVAYGLEMLDDTLVIDIGAGTVDLCRMHGTMPSQEDQITLTTAGDWLDQQLFTLIKQKAPDASFSIHQMKAIKEKFAFVSDAAEPIQRPISISQSPSILRPCESFHSSEQRISSRAQITPAARPSWSSVSSRSV